LMNIWNKVWQLGQVHWITIGDFFWSFSVDMNDELIIPVGSTTNPIPIMAMVASKIFPIGVIGYISPYPCVVSVATAHHNDSSAFSNLSGWACVSI